MRLDVSWICSRISFMPEIEFCTACVPFCAAASDWRATLADCEALSDIAFMALAMLRTEALVWRISTDCFSAAASSWAEVCCADSVALVTCAAAALIRPTRVLSSSMVKFTESAMAPVISSVTVAFSEVSHFVHQSQNRVLVRLVGALGFGALALGLFGAPARVAEVHQHEERDDTDAQQDQHAEHDEVGGAPAELLLIRVSKLLRRGEQRLGVVHDLATSLLRIHQRLQVSENRGHRPLEFLVGLVEFDKLCLLLRVPRRS